MVVVKEDIMAVMLSTAYTIPSLLDLHKKLPLLDLSYVEKFTGMYVDEVHSILREMNIKPLPMKYLEEDIYTLCSDILIHIGRFSGGLIPSEILLSQGKDCKKILMLHSHPVPLPLPTIEDLISSSQLGYSIECVISRTDYGFAEMLCIEPRSSWNDVIKNMESHIMEFYSIFKKYVVLEENQDMLFVPFPNRYEIKSAIDLVSSIVDNKAEIIYAGFNMIDKTYISYTLS